MFYIFRLSKTSLEEYKITLYKVINIWFCILEILSTAKILIKISAFDGVPISELKFCFHISNAE